MSRNKPREAEITNAIADVVAALEDREEVDGDWIGPARADALGVTIPDLAGEVGLSQSLVERALGRLVRAGVVAVRKCEIGRRRYYLASKSVASRVQSILDERKGKLEEV